MKCLGLDIGSTTIKGAALDLDQSQIGPTLTRAFPAPIRGLPPGWFEVSPAAIEAQTRQVFEALLDAAPDAVALYVSGQMGGVILTSEAGEPLGNYLSWRDQRTLAPSLDGASLLDKIRRRWGANLLQSLGGELQPGSATSLLYWLARRGELPQGAIPATVADFVIRRLCQAPPRMHVTQAIGMLNLHTSQWGREAFDLLELGGLGWPELSDGVEPVGTLHARGRSLQVYGAYGDQQCALRGAGLQRGDLSINISTGSQVSRRVATFTPGRYQTRRYFDGDLLNTITHLPAGRSLNALMDLLTELAAAEGISLKDPWSHAIRKAAELHDNDLEVDLAFFAGPLGVSGNIRHITTENLTVGCLFHAAFRSMAENYARCAEWLDPGGSWKAVVLSGGLTQAAPPLRRMIQDRFPVPLRESVGEETLAGLLDIAISHHP